MFMHSIIRSRNGGCDGIERVVEIKGETRDWKRPIRIIHHHVIKGAIHVIIQVAAGWVALEGDGW